MKRRYIVLILIIILITSFLYFQRRSERREFVRNRTFESLGNPFIIYDVVRYPSKVEIVEKGEKRVGMVGDPWNLNFGILPIGINGKRYINLANKEDRVFKVNLLAYGNISEWINFEKEEIELNPGDELTVMVLLNTSGSEPGNYTGEVDVVSRSAKHPFFNFLIRWF